MCQSDFHFAVDKPTELNFASVRESLMQIVPLCLDSDPSLMPQSCKLIMSRMDNATAVASSFITPWSPAISQLVLGPETPSLLDTSPLNQLSGSGSDPLTNAYPDFDPSSIPTNSNTDTGPQTSPSSNTDTLSLHTDDGDPDDFTFWEEQQAKRICLAIEQIFSVEYVPEVIVADANLTSLANRILLSKEILTG